MEKAAKLQAVFTAGRRIHMAVDTIDQIVCEKLSLHRSDLRCLHLLDEGPATPGEVGTHVGLTSGSVTALLDRLEGAGLVERRRCNADRRSVQVALPPGQETLVADFYSVVVESLASSFSSMNAAEVAEAGRILSLFAAALEAAIPQLEPATRSQAVIAD